MKVKSVLGVLISCLFLGCAVHRHIQPIEETRFLMDTVVRVSVYPDALSVDTVRAAIHEAFDEMERIERITSSTVSSSDVSLINSQANAQWTPISKETYTVMKTAMNVSENTDGAFDVTVGIADQLWNFTADQPNIPDEAAIRAILSRIGFRAVDMDPERCRLKQSGMRIDLGGLAKGYIVDKGVESLIKAGLLSGIVDAGGDLRLFGEHPTRNRSADQHFLWSRRNDRWYWRLFESLYLWHI